MGRRVGAGFGQAARVALVAVGCLTLGNCASSDRLSSKDSKYSPKVVEDGEPIPKGGGSYKLGQPYRINGRTFIPSSNPSYRAEGIASWYGPDFHGRMTANGEVYDMHSISAAHPTMPMPSYARVTNLANGRSIVVRVNDRGPYAQNRVIDVSVGAAKALEFYGQGLARVRVDYVGPAPLMGSDDRMLMATLRQGSPAPAPSLVRIASSVPFFPDFGAAGRDSGSTPVPAGRPFALGQTQGRLAAQKPPTEFAAADRKLPKPAVLPQERAAAPEYGARGQGQSTINGAAGFAPLRGDGTLGLMSGRGLY